MLSVVLHVMQLSDIRTVAQARKALRVSGFEICINFRVGLGMVA